MEYIIAAIGPDQVYNQKYGGLSEVLRNCKKDVAPILKERTLRRWWNFFLKYGTTQAEFHKKRKKTKNVTRWRQRHTETLKAIVDTNPDLYLDEIQMKMYEYRAGWWSTTTLWRKMKNELEYSLQVATDRSYSSSEEEQREYQAALAARLINPDQLIFIDESQKDRNSSRRRRSWSRRGQTPFRPAYLARLHGKRYTLLAACDVHGFVIEACETVELSHGSTDNDPSHGTVDRDRFHLWVREKLIPVLGLYEKAEARSIVIMDNASIHTEVTDLIEAAGAKLIYTAPYSPELNPIELMFGSYKASLKRNRGQPHYIAHMRSLQCVTPEIARAFYKHCKVPLCDHFPSQKELEQQKKVYMDCICVLQICCVVLLLLDEL